MTTLIPSQSENAAPPPVRRRKNRRGVSPALQADHNIFRSIGVLVLWVVVVLFIAMLVWVVLQAFRDTHAILESPWGLPTSFNFDNFATAWNVSGFALATLNSVVATAVSSFVCVAVAAPAAYYLSRVENRLTDGLSLYFILGLGIPVQVILIPLFVMLDKVHLTNSLFGLNLVYIGLSLPFTVFLLTAFFRSLPLEMEEAAALDGASALRTFVQVTLPLAKGGILTAFVLLLVGSWNETLLALTLLQSTEKYTLPVALISFVQQQTYSGADWGGLFAGLCIVILPMLAIYIWLGRRLTEGLTLGMGK